MKTTIVINGSGGVGKDTLCDIAAQHYRVMNVSSITPIKELARQCGWSGEKTDSARKFLSDLKALTIAYNDYPMVWLKGKYEEFLASDDEIMFVHIREPQEIAKFVRMTEGAAKTLLIRGGERMARRVGRYGNASDDEVEMYAYDHVFVNDRPLEESGTLFLIALCKIVE